MFVNIIITKVGLGLGDVPRPSREEGTVHTHVAAWHSFTTAVHSARSGPSREVVGKASTTQADTYILI